jgi:hypothetical protein
MSWLGTLLFHTGHEAGDAVMQTPVVEAFGRAGLTPVVAKPRFPEVFKESPLVGTWGVRLDHFTGTAPDLEEFWSGRGAR